VITLPRILVVVAATTLIAAPAAFAQSAPTLSAPSNGKALKRGVAFTFKANFDGGSDTSVFLRVSKSKKVGDDGVLADDQTYMRQMKGSGSLKLKTERFPALPSYWLNKPGKYYWQAYAIDCSAGLDDCNVESEIRSFRIK
jgi:hypothetical protein